MGESNYYLLAKKWYHLCPKKKVKSQNKTNFIHTAEVDKIYACSRRANKYLTFPIAEQMDLLGEIIQEKIPNHTNGI